MAYVSPNFKSKKALKDAVAARVAWEAQVRDLSIPESRISHSLANPVPAEVTVFEPGLGTVPVNGFVSLEGPHYPAPHTWYAEGTMRNGKLVKVK